MPPSLQGMGLDKGTSVKHHCTALTQLQKATWFTQQLEGFQSDLERQLGTYKTWLEWGLPTVRVSDVAEMGVPRSFGG